MRVRQGAADCWEWSRGKMKSGYGVFYIATKKPILAHRMALEINLGAAIPAGLFALHSCDNPGCVNPSHLRAGTPRENTHDAMSRGRAKRPPVNYRPGSTSHFAKLTEAQVCALLWDRISGMSLGALSHKYGIKPSGVSGLVNGRRWAHVFGTAGFPTLDQVQKAKKAPNGAKSRQLAAQRRGQI